MVIFLYGEIEKSGHQMKLFGGFGSLLYFLVRFINCLVLGKVLNKKQISRLWILDLLKIHKIAFLTTQINSVSQNIENI